MAIYYGSHRKLIYLVFRVLLFFYFFITKRNLGLELEGKKYLVNPGPWNLVGQNLNSGIQDFKQPRVDHLVVSLRGFSWEERGLVERDVQPTNGSPFGGHQRSLPGMSGLALAWEYRVQVMNSGNATQAQEPLGPWLLLPPGPQPVGYALPYSCCLQARLPGPLSTVCSCITRPKISCIVFTSLMWPYMGGGVLLPELWVQVTNKPLSISSVQCGVSYVQSSHTIWGRRSLLYRQGESEAQSFHLCNFLSS